MTAKIVLYTLIAAGAAYSVPSVRDKADPKIGQAWSHVTPHLRFITDPIRRNLAEREMSVIVGRLQEDHRSGRPLPDDSFQAWVRGATTVGRDPWQNAYYLVTNDDGKVYVGSNGPDGKRGTADDVLSPCTW